MTESKIEIVERLRREGRWPEASLFKDTAVKDFRSKGVGRAEATQAAWEAMATAYPPLAPIEGSASKVPDTASGNPRGHDGYDEELIDVDALIAKRPHDFARDVAWVYEHLADRNVKPQDAPGAGAWSLLTWGRRYRNRFFEMVVPKAMIARTDEEEGNRRKERKRIAEMEDILGNLQRQWEQELIADVPGTIQAKVRSTLSDWGRRFGLTIPPDAATSLGAHIAGLVQESVQAISRPSGDIRAT
jgi:hypothetical protein